MREATGLAPGCDSENITISKQGKLGLEPAFVGILQMIAALTVSRSQGSVEPDLRVRNRAGCQIIPGLENGGVRSGRLHCQKAMWRCTKCW
ncbi:hypothetical protein CEXT_187781 [Caerostris extrusa]|uniref:Uncharacterized protein n=1 Tax=Caerostris extrusa TaxID=172846 RepID=A0AAV4XHS1_CAEEX|nr:hypothetical protein CEXT_187781 [Caerostris extrusa]